MANWSPGGYRSGSRVTSAASARARKVQGIVSDGHIVATKDEGPEFRPPPRKKYDVEDWKRRVRKDGTRPEGTVKRTPWRYRGRFCVPETPEEKAAFIKEVRRLHALRRPGKHAGT